MLLTTWRSDLSSVHLKLVWPLLMALNMCFQGIGIIQVSQLHFIVCRPGHNLQEACYCGHWHEHAMSYQFLQLPNGLHLSFGPFNGNTTFYYFLIVIVASTFKEHFSDLEGSEVILILSSH